MIGVRRDRAQERRAQQQSTHDFSDDRWLSDCAEQPAHQPADEHDGGESNEQMPNDVGRRRAGRTLCLGCSDGGWRR